jgi:2-polyprenyl-3-methyl-5-hydroxy-6-metoxy-1,4-benzoquinol methylase
MDLLWKSDVPVMQNRLYTSREDAMRAAVAPLELVFEPQSGLVYNARFDPNLLEYSEGYNNEQSLSPTFVGHMESVAGIIQRYLEPFERVVEIGCGKGAFLRMLRSNGILAVGLDPAYEGDEPYIQKRVFEPDAGMDADFVVLRHVLEHIPNPSRFLQQIAKVNRRRGRIFIEVPDLSWIIEHRAFYDLFYEHCNYFTASSLAAQFERVLDAGTFLGISISG